MWLRDRPFVLWRHSLSHFKSLTDSLFTTWASRWCLCPFCFADHIFLRGRWSVQASLCRLVLVVVVVEGGWLLIWGFKHLIRSKSLRKSLSWVSPISLLSSSTGPDSFRRQVLIKNHLSDLSDSMPCFSQLSFPLHRKNLLGYHHSIYPPPPLPHCWQIHTTMWDTKARI